MSIFSFAIEAGIAKHVEYPLALATTALWVVGEVRWGGGSEGLEEDEG